MDIYELDDSICRAKKKNNGVKRTRIERLGKARLVAKRKRERQQGMPWVVRLSKQGNKRIPKRARRLSESTIRSLFLIQRALSSLFHISPYI